MCQCHPWQWAGLSRASLDRPGVSAAARRNALTLPAMNSRRAPFVATFRACSLVLLLAEPGLPRLTRRHRRGTTHLRRRRHGCGDPGRTHRRGADPFAALASTSLQRATPHCNLECVMATGGQAETKPYTFRADPRAIAAIDTAISTRVAGQQPLRRFRQGRLRRTTPSCSTRRGLPVFRRRPRLAGRARAVDRRAATACALHSSATASSSRVRSKPMPASPGRRLEWRRRQVLS